MRKVQVKFADFVRGEHRSDDNSFTVYAREAGGEWQNVGWGAAEKSCTYSGLFQSDDRYAIDTYTIQLYTGRTPFSADQEAFTIDEEYSVDVGQSGYNSRAIANYPTPAKAKAAARAHAVHLITKEVERVQALADASREPEVIEEEIQSIKHHLKLSREGAARGEWQPPFYEEECLAAIANAELERRLALAKEALKAKSEELASVRELLGMTQEELFRRPPAVEAREPADPDSLPEVDAEDLESHASVRTVKRAYVADVEAEVEDCGHGAYELVLRAEHGEDLLHFVGGRPEDGAINATFSTEEMQVLASLFLSFPALSRALRSPSLLPSSPPTPPRGEAKDGEDGISLSGALNYLGRQYIPIETHRMILREVYGRLDAKSEEMASHEAKWEAERAKDIDYLLEENRALSASLKALQREKDSQYVRAWTSPGDIPGLVTERPVREDGRRRWGNALWAVACRDLGIGDCSRNGTKHIIWLDDEEEALVRLWVEEYRGGGQ